MPIVSKIKKNQGFLLKKLKCNIPIFLNNIYTRINVINILVCQYLKNNKGLSYGCYKGSKHTNKNGNIPSDLTASFDDSYRVITVSNNWYYFLSDNGLFMAYINRHIYYAFS
jgi:hypothetical protein